MVNRGLEIAVPDLPAVLPQGNRWYWHPWDKAWIRIYHRDHYTPTALHRRNFGPLHRFDHHTPPFESAAICPDGRAITYIADSLRSAAAEVFSDLDPFPVCPRWRVARLRPSDSIHVQDITEAGGMAIGGAPWLGSGPLPREYTQAWSRKIYEQTSLHGILYTGSHEEGRCLALWERAPDVELVTKANIEFDLPVTSPEIWGEVVADYAETKRSLRQIEAVDCDWCRSAEAAEAAAAEV